MRHAERDHAKYSGSSAARTLACPAWVRLSAGMPRRETDASEAGTEAHELLEACLLAGREYAPRDADPEMADAVNAVLDYVTNLRLVHGGDLLIWHEMLFEFPQTTVPKQDAAGVPDIVLFNPRAKQMWIVDFKYGSGIMVAATNNAQLLYGAVSVVMDRPIEKVTCTVIQPRGWHPAGPVREWITDGVALAEFQLTFEAAIKAAEAGGDPSPGPHCRFCPAAVCCPEFERRAVQVINPDGTTYREVPMSPPKPTTIPMERIAHIVANADRMREWLKEVENYAYEQARSGVKVPGRKLVEASDRRKYVGGVDAVAKQIYALSGGHIPMTDIVPAALAPITKMEAALIKVARDAALPGQADAAARTMRERFAFLTSKASSGNLALVPDSDPRPAADRTAQAFKGVALPPLPGQESVNG